MSKNESEKKGYKGNRKRVLISLRTDNADDAALLALLHSEEGQESNRAGLLRNLLLLGAYAADRNL